MTSASDESGVYDDPGAAFTGSVREILRPQVGNDVTTWHVAPDGRRLLAPELPSGSRFDVRKLALYLAQPALYGEFRPVSPWEGWRLEREIPAAVPSTRAQLREMFDVTVERLIEGHKVVAVRVSGGIDSCAVLSAVKRTTSPRAKVVAIVTEATSDQGARVSRQAARVINAVFPSADVVVIPEGAEGAVEWSPIGPNLEAAPSRNAAALEAAIGARATLVLSGDGADELLATPAFLAAEIAGCLGTRSALRYLADHDRNDLATTIMETASAILLRKRPEHSAQVYSALTSSGARYGRMS